MTYQLLLLYWPKLMAFLKGKRVTILGMRAIGKTHLIHFLTEGSLPSHYESTLEDKIGSTRVKLRDLELILKEGTDHGGSQELYTRWKSSFEESDVVLYLLPADRVASDDRFAIQRIEEDLNHIGEWHGKRSSRVLFLVGTRCDLIPEYDANPSRYRGEFLDRQPVKKFIALLGGMNRVKIALGSMDTLVNTEKLAYEIFRQV